MRLLLVEDFKPTRTFVAKHLRRAGYATDTAADGEDALMKGRLIDYDAIILDLMLPKLSGGEVLKQLREGGCNTHILILTARTAVEDRVAGLRAGADDYLVKPFEIAELLARVEALVRRRYESKTNVLTAGELAIDKGCRVVTVRQQPVRLRPREFALLEYLVQREGQVVSRHEIEQHLYSLAESLASNSVESSICRLRRELKEAGAGNYIQTFHRQGYALRVPEAPFSNRTAS